MQSRIIKLYHFTFEPRCEKTGTRGFRSGLTQTGLCTTPFGKKNGNTLTLSVSGNTLKLTVAVATFKGNTLTLSIAVASVSGNTLKLSVAVTTVSVNIITVSVAFAFVNFNTLTRCNRLCQHVNT